MKIVILGSYAPSLVTFRGPLMQDMANMGHEVIACAPESPAHVVAALNKMGVVYRKVFIERTGTNPMSDLKTFFSLRELFLELQPDIVLSYTIKPVIYGSLAAEAANVPNIYSMITGAGYVFGNSSSKQKLIKVVTVPMFRAALRTNTKVFFQNPDDRTLFLDMKLVSGDEQCVLINGSGVDVDYYWETPPVTDRIVFLLIARLIREKGIFEYVGAARLIKKKYPDVVFNLLGPFDTNPTAISEEQVREWQDDEIIDYLGETTDVRPFIAESSVYVLPSYREGTPRTVLEAMSMGRPIITTDVPGCRETVIDGKNGYLVPVKDVDAFVETMERFILNPEIIPVMGRESRRIAVDKYDVRKINEVILDAMGLSCG